MRFPPQRRQPPPPPPRAPLVSRPRVSAPVRLWCRRCGARVRSSTRRTFRRLCYTRSSPDPWEAASEQHAHTQPYSAIYSYLCFPRFNRSSIFISIFSSVLLVGMCSHRRRCQVTTPIPQSVMKNSNPIIIDDKVGKGDSVLCL